MPTTTPKPKAVNPNAGIVAQQKRLAIDLKISDENAKFTKVGAEHTKKVTALNDNYNKSNTSHNAKITKLNADKAKIVG